MPGIFLGAVIKWKIRWTRVVWGHEQRSISVHDFRVIYL